MDFRADDGEVRDDIELTCRLLQLREDKESKEKGRDNIDSDCTTISGRALRISDQISAYWWIRSPPAP